MGTFGYLLFEDDDMLDIQLSIENAIEHKFPISYVVADLKASYLDDMEYEDEKLRF